MATAPEKDPAHEVDEWTKPPFLRRVRIQGYKSIAFCDVTLEPLTILVGRNAAGKSNFLDALAFLRDVMEVGLAESLKRRGNWPAVVSRTLDTPKIEIEIEAVVVCGRPWQRIRDLNGPSALTASDFGSLPDYTGKTFTATYRLEFSPDPHSVPSISNESLEITDGTRQLNGGFEVRNGIVQRWRSNSNSSAPLSLPSSVELLAILRPGFPLLSVVGVQPFLELGDGLRSMGFYNFQPEAIRNLQRPNRGWLLEKDGHNLASVIETTRENEEWAINRVGRYLSAITNSVELLSVVNYGPFETVRFRVARSGTGRPLELDAASMSDGTLRTLAALVAAFQIVLPHGSPNLIGIEEPETSLHPAAMRALVDALDEATSRTQILLTTHSTEMLDNPTVRSENIRVLQLVDGQTVIGPVDEANVEIVARKLNSLGGLERENQLEPDLDDQSRQRELARAR